MACYCNSQNNNNSGSNNPEIDSASCNTMQQLQQVFPLYYTHCNNLQLQKISKVWQQWKISLEKYVYIKEKLRIYRSRIDIILNTNVVGNIYLLK